jgi:hypothetical protein
MFDCLARNIWPHLFQPVSVALQILAVMHLPPPATPPREKEFFTSGEAVKKNLPTQWLTCRRPRGRKRRLPSAMKVMAKALRVRPWFRVMGFGFRGSGLGFRGWGLGSDRGAGEEGDGGHGAGQGLARAPLPVPCACHSKLDDAPNTLRSMTHARTRAARTDLQNETLHTPHSALHPEPSEIHPPPHSPYPTPYPPTTPQPCTRNPRPQTPDPRPYALNQVPAP